MINLKESCRKCKGIDRCIKAVAHNINNMHLPHKKDAIRCINFGYFQSAVTKYVMDGFDQALLEYVPVVEDMCQAYQSFERSMLSEYKYLQKVKVSPDFFAYLHAASDPFGTGPSQIPDGKVAYFNCVPIEIDDDIKGYYEFVY
jgi:hypothetical protein